jgi:hypothetical protein
MLWKISRKVTTYFSKWARPMLVISWPPNHRFLATKQFVSATERVCVEFVHNVSKTISFSIIRVLCTQLRNNFVWQINANFSNMSDFVLVGFILRGKMKFSVLYSQFCDIFWLNLIYRVSQEERSIFWEVTVSVILSKMCKCTCVLFRTVSEIELFHCTVPKLLIRNRYYACSSDDIGTVYLIYYSFEKFTVNINAIRASCEGMACCSSVQWNSSISETVLNRTHIHMHFFA